MKYGLILSICALLCVGANAATTYDVLTVNGHPGYITAMQTSPDGVVDKVMVLVTGFDTSNDSHPIDDLTTDYWPVVEQMGPQGWDIIIFDYVRGDIDIRQNADNLARFIEYLDTIAVPDYHLAIVGGSMGGIVTRCMFVQENSSKGAETYVSVDSPHHGVYLSAWIEGLAPFLVDAYAGHQMANGEPEYNELYGWMRSVEASPGFKTNIINPMATLAIALSNGESSWDVDWDDLAIHTKYHEVCSYVYSDGLWSDYMPYHSVCMFDDTGTTSSTHFGYTRYWYNNTSTSYFDQKQPNPQTEHSAPPFAIQQAIDFVVAHGPATPPPTDTTAPVLTLNGPATLSLWVGSVYTEQGATVFDEGDPNCQVVISGTVNTAVAGTYVVTYTATDASGNVATPLTRTVTVVADTTAPVLTLNGPATLSLKKGSTYTEQGATVFDEGDPNCQVVITGTVNTAVVGTYVRYYNATDASGNVAAQLTRTITVTRK
jgi:pimeloyl-ACP methyl ester carboxylesterase